VYAGLVTSSAVLSLNILESNHNVSVTLKKQPSTMKPPAANRIVRQETRITLLHPFDASRSRELLLSTSSHNSHQLSINQNFMTSKELDEFCINGRYYVSC
jgi:hypothetical protein